MQVYTFTDCEAYLGRDDTAGRYAGATVHEDLADCADRYDWTGLPEWQEHVETEKILALLDRGEPRGSLLVEPGDVARHQPPPTEAATMSNVKAAAAWAVSEELDRIAAEAETKAAAAEARAEDARLAAEAARAVSDRLNREADAARYDAIGAQGGL